MCVTATTRAPRHNERNGVNYKFLSHEEFKDKLEADEMVEYSEVMGEYQGT